MKLSFTKIKSAKFRCPSCGTLRKLDVWISRDNDNGTSNCFDCFEDVKNSEIETTIHTKVKPVIRKDTR